MTIRAIALSIVLGATATAAVAQTPEVQIPRMLSKPGDEIVAVFRAGGGSQTYQCYRANGQSYWQYVGPRAPLRIEEKVFGRVQTGPIWTHNDGSSITGKVVQEMEADKPENFKYERYEVVSSRGQGTFSGVTAVVMIDTESGVLTGACKEHGQIFGEPYWATYVFLKSK